MKKGFTLIELLAVIVILAIIASITTVITTKTINNAKKNLSVVQQGEAEKAAQQYYLKSNIDLEEGQSTCINISLLIDEGYIENNTIIDPKTNAQLVGSIKIEYRNNQYSYNYQKDECN